MIPQTKKQIVEKALEKGHIQVFVNSTLPGVQVPPNLMGNSKLILNLSWGFKTYMELRDDAIYADLSFNRENWKVILPWQTIWFLQSSTTNESMLFFEGAPLDDLPVEVLQPPEFTPETLTETLTETLKPVQGSIDGEGQTTPPRTGHLRLLH